MQATTTNVTLQKGSKGIKVREMKEMLNRRVNRDLKVVVDEIFDEKTEETLKIFQFSRLLKSDGIV